MSRFDDRKARALERRQAFRQAHTYPITWVVACFIIAASFAGLLISMQSLRSDVSRLERQLSTKPTPAPSTMTTCEVRGKWVANTTTKLVISGRKVFVHTPQNFTPTTYLPMLLVFSGKGATAEGIQQAFGLDTLPALVVYPEPTIGTEGVTAWQGAPYSSAINDITFTGNVLDELESQLCVDRTRIYATGFSNGGGFAALLSCDLSDRFAAYAVVGGAMYPAIDSCKPRQPVSLLNIHGDNDPVVPYHGSPVRKLPDIDDWTARRAALDGCKRIPTTTVTGNMLDTTWTNCHGGSVIKSLRFQGGGHAWGAVPNGDLWKFLTRFSL